MKSYQSCIFGLFHPVSQGGLDCVGGDKNAEEFY
jgi:hypothetical protein